MPINACGMLTLGAVQNNVLPIWMARLDTRLHLLAVELRCSGFGMVLLCSNARVVLVEIKDLELLSRSWISLFVLDECNDLLAVHLHDVVALHIAKS